MWGVQSSLCVRVQSSIWGGIVLYICGGYSPLHMWGVQSSICGGYSPLYVGGTVLYMWGVQSSICGGVQSSICGGVQSSICGGYSPLQIPYQIYGGNRITKCTANPYKLTDWKRFLLIYTS